MGGTKVTFRAVNGYRAHGLALALCVLGGTVGCADDDVDEHEDGAAGSESAGNGGTGPGGRSGATAGRAGGSAGTASNEQSAGTGGRSRAGRGGDGAGGVAAGAGGEEAAAGSGGDAAEGGAGGAAEGGAGGAGGTSGAGGEAAGGTGGAAEGGAGGTSGAAEGGAGGVGGTVAGTGGAAGGVAGAGGIAAGAGGSAAGSGGAPADTVFVEATIESGRIRGKQVGESKQFLGIPYAKAPTGPLRFLPPVKPDAWSDTIDTLEYGPSCPQAASSLGAPGAQSEDCLSLNVFAPATDAANLPVLVWIHGGAYVSGGSSTPTYDGARLATGGPAVVVTLNYRLGALGFLSHPALDAARSGVPSGNDAIRDQQLALTWVKNNITNFGGNASNITVFGESAGSSSTCVHLVSPSAAGLASRYILESGSCVASTLVTTKEAANTVGTELANALCPDATDKLACLRGKDATELVSWGADSGVSGAGWAPVVQGGDPVLPEAPEALIASGKHNRGPVLLGTNKNEWGLFVQLQMTQVDSLATLHTTLLETFPEPLVTAIEAQYTPTDETAAQVFVDVMTDAIFRCPTRTLARSLAAADENVYLYSFEEGPAFHAFEIPYVFGNPSPALGASDVDALHAILSDYWLQFAQTGDPNVDGRAEWPRYEVVSDQHLILQAQPAAGSGLAATGCDFWDLASVASP
ncbi:MAG: carboxylesterase family protein [Polyangiales bacterium]